MSSAGADGRVFEMRMRRHDPAYSVGRHATPLAETGTPLKTRPLLPGVHQPFGDKVQRYLASELRERIRQSGVRIRVADRQGRKELPVEPRQLSELPRVLGRQCQHRVKERPPDRLQRIARTAPKNAYSAATSSRVAPRLRHVSADNAVRATP